MKYVVDSTAGSKNRQLSDIAEIQNLTFPSEVNPGLDFNVSYDSINKSSVTQHLFGYIVDNTTQAQVPGSFWEADVASNQIYSVLVTFGGITEPFSGDAVLGHVEYAECEQITDPTECTNAGCEWYDNSCHSPAPPQCSDYLNQTDCEANSCFWYNGSCHDAAPTCEIITDATECIDAGCEWYDNSCHSPAPPQCSDYTDPTECINAGCFWYDEACHSTEQGELPEWVMPVAIAGVGAAIIIAIVAVKKPWKHV